MKIDHSRNGSDAPRSISFPIKVGLDNAERGSSAGWDREKRLSRDARRDKTAARELSRDAKRDMRYR